MMSQLCDRSSRIEDIFVEECNISELAGIDYVIVFESDIIMTFVTIIRMIPIDENSCDGDTD